MSARRLLSEDSARGVLIAAPALETGGMLTYLHAATAALWRCRWNVHVAIDGATEGAPAVHASRTTFLPPAGSTMERVHRAARLIDDSGASVVLLNHSAAFQYALPLTGVPAAVVVHSDDARFYRLATAFARRVAAWIAPTPRVAERCRAALPSRARQRVHLVPHGLETPAEAPLPWGARDDHVVFVGRLEQHKGVDLLPSILEKVRNHVPSVRFSIFGTGPLESWLHMEAGRRRLHVQFVPNAEPARVQATLGCAKVLLLPTRLEGFGLVLLEAMQQGTVPVTTRLDGITDSVVEHGITGLLAASDDVPGLTAAVIAVLRSPSAGERMSLAAREHARTRFSAERMGRAYDAILAAAARRAHRPRGWIGWTVETLEEVTRVRARVHVAPSAWRGKFVRALPRLQQRPALPSQPA